MSDSINAPLIKVVIVDDESEILQIYTDHLSRLGYQVLRADSAESAIPLIRENIDQLGIIVSDFKMGGQNGIELRKAIIAETKHIPFVIISGHVSREDALQAVELKISGFLEKPIREDGFIAFIEKHIEERKNAILEDYELLSAFSSESDLLIEEMEGAILHLEGNPGDLETINRVFAIAHTLKGSSGFFNPKTVHNFTHKYEDFLSYYKKNALPLNKEAISVLLKGLDIIKKLIADLKTQNKNPEPLESLVTIFNINQEANSPKSEAAVGGVAQVSGTAKREEIRVPIKTLDQFMELTGEITVIRNMINKRVKAIEKEVGLNSELSLLGDLLSEMHRIQSMMQDKIVDLRKVGLKEVYRPLHRAIRDLCGSLKKEIEFKASGEEIRVDTSISDILSSSLIHMVRNCVDHGIEDAKTREANHKPKVGQVSLDAKIKGEDVVVTLSDDGKGIDAEVIRKKVVEKNLRDPVTASKMSKEELYLMIFESGFSTAAQITDVSGRGVGMDMVKRSIMQGAGKIEIQSQVGQGTKFDLVIPIPKSVTIINSLLVRVGSERVGIPQDNLVRLVSLDRKQQETRIRCSESATFYLHEESLVPIVDLESVFFGEPDQIFCTNGHELLQLAVLKTEVGLIALRVDEILDNEDTVVKKLGKHLSSLEYILGGTFFGDGQVGIILDIDGLSRWVNIKKASRNAVQEASPMIKTSSPTQSILLVNIGEKSNYGIALQDVYRIEEFDHKSIQKSGGTSVVIYRDDLLPLYSVQGIIGLNSQSACELPLSANSQTVKCFVIKRDKGYVGFCVNEILDVVDTSAEIDSSLNTVSGVMGALILEELGKTVTLLSASELIKLVEMPFSPVANSEEGVEDLGATQTSAA